MKTSIFDMNFTLPPMVGMTEVVKEMNTLTGVVVCANTGACDWNC